jgi:uncharacterized membrane protein YqaE (UPF0057 family)
MDIVENDIQRDNYTLFQRILYGGVSHGVVIIPTHFFKILITLLFPPIGEIFNIITSVPEFIADKFPWITWNAIVNLVKFENLNLIIYSFILTSMFYIPGLIYVLAELTPNTNYTPGTLKCRADTGKCELITPVKTPTTIESN